MLSHSRCLCRTLGRSLSALSQCNNVLAGRTASGLSTGNRVVYGNTQLCESPSSIVFHIRSFKTSAARREEVVTVNTPPFSESITEGDVRWEKAVGDSVKEDEVVCEIETDKTSLQVPSPAAGVVTELLVPDGGRVEAGNPLFKLKRGAAASEAAPAAEVPAAVKAAPAAEVPAAVKAAPAAEVPAAAAAPPPTLAAVPVAVPPLAAQAKPFSAVKPTATPPAAAAHGARTESRVKMNRMRLRIAQRLKEAQQTCAMLTTFNEIDMSNIQEMRKLHKDAFQKKHNIELGFMSAFVKASAHALMDQPSVNGVIDDTTKEIVYRDYVDISVAVATSKGLVVYVLLFTRDWLYMCSSSPGTGCICAPLHQGLVVYVLLFTRDWLYMCSSSPGTGCICAPLHQGLVVSVIRNVETMNFADVEKTINGLGEKARNNLLAVEDMDGGTFTISNGGVFGSLFGTPIINPPQSAILGMHGIFDRPVAIGGKVEIRPMMYVALTYDHRLVDGREAVTFLRKIKSVVEDPRVLLLDM
ncbi:dihydrolipoyllysine-residue succinyltransferase component of 2-oxoglutarate dehydrogenase complex, mitochondrial-like isoform X4 [Salvelinus fontinalis]|uniref:dihydrolipoyllysine-residue succinyltransferase component of 2-oxoglutarate dehydrogenase complex, mitochondrial-like isoform X4 n=1 Tax=Salvelinus fontinalis TaxID=8038 RepID=UPI002485BFD5|nr:dihydrolipoyllysine-residue succinyltransferase component of 2-oxoglutarate dehydrogenase complex, mitochondrial-like isoform X4 [Salvelinus fontinalis]